MSPKEMVSAFTRRGSMDFGIEDYTVPKFGSPEKKNKGGVISKDKEKKSKTNMSNIEREALFRADYPAAANYHTPYEKTW